MVCGAIRVFMPKGTIDDPLSLTEALEDSYGVMRAGDTIVLRGGTYSGDLKVLIKGAATEPITIKPHDNERVIINGDVDLSDAAYLDWYDTEVRQEWPDGRFSEEEGSNPSDIELKGLTFSAPNTRLINWTIHDAGGVGFWNAALNSLLYGALIYNIGWDAIDRGHGHGIYVQHTDSDNPKEIKHCVVSRTFSGWGLHAYGSTPISGVNIDGLVTIGHASNQYGGHGRDGGVVIDNSVLYGGVLQLGYQTDNNLECSLQNSILYDDGARPLMVNRWGTIDIRGNTVISANGDSNMVEFIQADTPRLQTWNNNEYYNVGGRGAPFRNLTLEQWRATYGFDTDSVEVSNGSYPADSVIVVANEHAADSRRKGHIVILNWSQQESVGVDLSALGLRNGESYVLRQAQDPFGDTQEFTYDGSAVTVDMRAASHSVAVPTAHNEALTSTTFPTFGCLILERTA